MNLKSQQIALGAIVYDADCVEQPEPELFDPIYWDKKEAIVETALGRGNALLLDTDFGPLVLRSYLRGGWAAHISRDQYIYTGVERSRPFAEVRILERMLEMGLPVPRPFAGLCQRNGISYSAVLITHRITHAKVLADLLENNSNQGTDWLAIGRCIRRFHDAGVIHPDLNARNIMMNESRFPAPAYGSNEDEGVYLIDFDRAHIRPGANRSFKSNLDRLHRSLVKLWPARRAGELETCWMCLIDGYKTTS
jgi:3-deoxy-D-manno-octulosonic acid kinase